MPPVHGTVPEGQFFESKDSLFIIILSSFIPVAFHIETSMHIHGSESRRHNFVRVH